MAKRRKFTADERQYWGQAFIAIAQVTFAAFWAALFLPNLDSYRLLMILLNLAASVIFFLLGWLFIRRIRK